MKRWRHLAGKAEIELGHCRISQESVAAGEIREASPFIRVSSALM